MATSKDVLASLAIRIGIDSANMSKSLNKITSDMNIFKNGLKTLGKAAAGVFAVDRIIDFGKSSFNAFMEGEKAARKLSVALKGNVSQFKELNDLAKRQQSITTFGDEESMDAMTRMRSLMGDNIYAIKKLLPLVQDLAVVKEMDLASAADLVAKSVATSTNALKRQGIEITGAAGSSERLESAVAALTKAFGGQAEALGNTLYGQLIKTRNAWDEIKESIGAVISGPVQKSAKAWQVWAEVMTSNVSAWEKWKATFTSASKLVEQYEAKYGKVADNLERIRKIQESGKPVNSEGEYLFTPGLTGTIGSGTGTKESTALLTEAKLKLEEYKKAAENAITEADLSKWNRKIQLQEKEIDRLNQLGKAIQQFTEVEQKANLADMAESVAGPSQSAPLTPIPGKALNSWTDTGEQGYVTYELFADFKAKKEEYISGLEQMKKSTLDTVNQIKSIIGDMAVSFAESIGTMIGSGQKANWGMILNPIAEAMASLGKLAIAAGVATLGIKKALMSMNGYAAIAAGAALIVVASAIKAGMNNIASGMGSSSSSNVSGVASSYGSDYINRNMGEGYENKLQVELILRNDHLAAAVTRGTNQMARW